MSRFLVFLSLCAIAAPAAAQSRFAHDTLGPEMPTGVTCGFCAGERFGVIFRELPAPRRGLEPTDFPLVLDTLEIGLASATVAGTACEASEEGGVAMAQVEVWAGSQIPTGAIRDLPELDAWTEGETLIFATDAAPITLSSADATGEYEVNLNAFEVQDEMSQPIRIESGSYLRVVVTLPAGEAGTSSLCEPAYDSPAGFPVRDDDGVIAPERSFIYASGAGWFWNEAVPGGSINGDWAIRVTAIAEGPGPSSDAGASSVDAGAPPAVDSGAAAFDAGPSADAGGGSEGGGCSVSSTGAGDVPLGFLCPLIGLCLVTRRLRSARKLR